MAKEQPGLNELQQRIGYQFRDEQSLVAALTHSSATDIAGPRASERLEFLGDAVLGLAFELQVLLWSKRGFRQRGQWEQPQIQLYNSAAQSYARLKGSAQKYAPLLRERAVA